MGKENRQLESIRKVIRKMVAENMSMPEGGGGDSKARLALIALSSGSETEVVDVDGRLSGADFDEQGYTSSTGEVYVEWNYRGDTYTTVFNVHCGFYLQKGSDGRYGASVDDSYPPEPDYAEDLEVEIEDSRFLVGDEEGEEFSFEAKEFAPEVIKGLESFLLSRYDAIEETIS